MHKPNQVHSELKTELAKCLPFMSWLVLPCCSFAAGAARCVSLTEEVKDFCPFYNDTVEEHLSQNW